jgi:hypothetical protein
MLCRARRLAIQSTAGLISLQCFPKHPIAWRFLSRFIMVSTIMASKSTLTGECDECGWSPDIETFTKY